MHKAAQPSQLTPTSGAKFNPRQIPRLLDILLLDRTATTPDHPRNIVWANNHFVTYDTTGYDACDPITSQLISHSKAKTIRPRAQKPTEQQRHRTKTNAEVFTPLWIVKIQNDAVDADYQADDIETYVRRKWLEISCGEAPYMTTRYHMETGEPIPIPERQGFVDRKLARINAEVTDKAEWQSHVELAYQASYGFEWNGDSLLLARENLLATYHDYYCNKWNAPPSQRLLEAIATIISFNLFQMDGITGTLPPARYETKPAPEPVVSESKPREIQALLFNPDPIPTAPPLTTGIKAKIMNWDFLTMEPFLPGEAAP